MVKVMGLKDLVERRDRPSTTYAYWEKIPQFGCVVGKSMCTKPSRKRTNQAGDPGGAQTLRNISDFKNVPKRGWLLVGNGLESNEVDFKVDAGPDRETVEISYCFHLIPYSEKQPWQYKKWFAQSLYMKNMISILLPSLVLMDTWFQRL